VPHPLQEIICDVAYEAIPMTTQAAHWFPN
jgi:hypothetical protein